MKIFETSKCSSQILWNALCEFWNELIPLQILYPSSVSWKINPLYFFSSNNIYFAQKKSIKMKIFYTFECLGQYLSNLKRQVDSSPNFVSLFRKDYCSVLFSLKQYILCSKGALLKWKFLRLSSARVKICRIPYAKFETSIPLQSLSPSSISSKIIPLFFFSSNNI